VRRLFRRLVDDEGATLLISSHQLHELSGVCNRIGILREGRLLMEKETDALLSAERVRVVAGDRAAAARVFADRALTFDATDSEFLVDVAGDEADALVQALVTGGAQPREFAPHQTSLEDVYLRVARDRGEGATVAGTARAQRDPAPPSERIAPSAPVLRVIGYELRRLAASRGALLGIATPALAGIAGLLYRYARARGFATEVEAGGLFSTTDVSAFEGVATALRFGLPVLAIVGAALASQQIAGERSRETLRNVVVRPLSRLQLAVGKTLALGIAVLASHALLVVGAIAASAVASDFADVTEMFNGNEMIMASATDLWAPLRLAVVLPLPAVLACASVGMLAGGLFRRSAAALAGAFISLGVLDIGRAVLAGFHAERFSPLHYIPTWLRDRSFIRYFMDLTQGTSNTQFDLTTEQWAVPLVWCSGMFVLSAVLLVRRAIR